MKKLFLSIISILFSVTVCHATVLEVGSGYPYTTIQAAVNVAVAGDIVSIHAGTYTGSCVIGSCGGGNNYSPDATRSANVKLKSSGTLANPITIKNYGDGEVILDGSGTVAYNIYSVSYSYWIIDGLTLKNASFISVFWKGTASLDLTVQNNIFQGTTSAPTGSSSAGVSVNDSSDEVNNNTTVLNNTFTLPGAQFVIDIMNSNDSLISGNTITGGDYGIYLHNYTDGSTIKNNIITGNTTDVTGIFVRDADNFTISYNLIKGNYGNYHILYQDGSRPQISTGVSILNNTIDCGLTNTTGIKETDTWATTNNNIIYNCYVDIRGINPANLPADQPGYNLLYDAVGRYTTFYRYLWSSAEQWPQGTGNLTSNPLFVVAGTDYHLQSGSPAENAGIDVGLTSDIEGTAITGLPDIGSYEIQSSCTPSKVVFTTQPNGGDSYSIWTQQPIIKIENSSSVVCTTATNIITLTIGTNPSSGTLYCTTNPLTPFSGVSAFSGCYINNTGNGYTLIASASGLTSDTSSSFNITTPSCVPSKVVFTTETGGGYADVVWSTQPVISIKDVNNIMCADATNTVTLAIGTNPGSGTLSCSVNPLAAVSGVSLFANCSINSVGTGYTISAASTGLTGSTSSTFNIIPSLSRAQISRTLLPRSQVTRGQVER